MALTAYTSSFVDQQFCAARRARFTFPIIAQVMELDLGMVVPCCSGPKRPHDRVSVSDMKSDFQACLSNKVGFKVSGAARKVTVSGAQVTRPGFRSMAFISLGSRLKLTRLQDPVEDCWGIQQWGLGPNVSTADLVYMAFAFQGFGLKEAALGSSVPFQFDGADYTLSHGSVVIAAITSCTNTSNPSVMLGAGGCGTHTHTRTHQRVLLGVGKYSLTPLPHSHTRCLGHKEFSCGGETRHVTRLP